MLSLLVDGNVFTGDTLFKGSVGGVRAPGHTTYADLKHSIMDTLLALPPRDRRSTPATPTRRRSPTSGRHNAFVRIWRGLDPEGDEPCTALGEPATLVLLGDDYDGGHKAWVRWPDGSDDIVPGSQVERAELAGREPASKDKIPTSRLARTAKVGRLAAGQAVAPGRARARRTSRAPTRAQQRRSRAASSRPPSRSSPRSGR